MLYEFAQRPQRSLIAQPNTGVLSRTFLSLLLLSSLPQFVFFTLANSIYNLIMKIKIFIICSFICLCQRISASEIDAGFGSCWLQKQNLDHSRMFIQSKMVIFVVMIVLGCSAVANESENCDRVQFSFDDQNDINSFQNFTKQSFEKNGQPVYFSFSRTKNQYKYTYIWWNNETWLSKTMTDSSNKITKVKINLYLSFCL